MKTLSCLILTACLSAATSGASLRDRKVFDRSKYHRRAHNWEAPGNWQAPGPGDVRAPCPMLNSLANHGFLPHSGKNITQATTVAALSQALNIGEDIGVFLHKEAVTTNPIANATTFSLDDLSRHNILEHDASLSRLDAYFGDNHDFNEEVFDETRSYWTEPIINITTAAEALAARKRTSQATNPTYGLSDLGQDFGFGETAAYILILGDKVSATVKRSLVEYLFQHEKLPVELGWSKPNATVVFDDLTTMLDRVVNATVGNATLSKRGGFHGER